MEEYHLLLNCIVPLTFVVMKNSDQANGNALVLWRCHYTYRAICANTNKSVLQISLLFQFWIVPLNDTTGKQVMESFFLKKNFVHLHMGENKTVSCYSEREARNGKTQKTHLDEKEMKSVENLDCGRNNFVKNIHSQRMTGQLKGNNSLDWFLTQWKIDCTERFTK